MNKHLVFASTFAIIIITSCSNHENFIPCNHPQIAYEGRIGENDSSAYKLYWPGTSITINFKGTDLEAQFEDERGENYYNVIIDNDSIAILDLDSVKKWHPLVTGLKEGKHTVEVFKRTEWDRGKTLFYGFKLGSKGKILNKSKSKERKIEFFGNSITAGYAVEDYEADRWEGFYTNNYNTYANMLARHYNAQYHCTVKSGIGIMISWFPMIMPEMYNRLDPTDSTSIWDFSLYTPDLVIINLFQNDSWLVEKPEREEFKTNFGTEPPTEEFTIQAYYNFVKSIRETYPDAQIICILGSMDITREESPWPGYVDEAVRRLNDKNIYTYFIPYKNTPGHPKVHEQRVMADSLIAFIDRTITW